MIILRDKYYAKGRNIIDEDFLEELEDNKNHKKAHLVAGGLLGAAVSTGLGGLAHKTIKDRVYKKVAAAAAISAGVGGGLYLGKKLHDSTVKEMDKLIEKYKDADVAGKKYLRDKYNKNIDRNRETNNAIIAGSLAGR